MMIDDVMMIDDEMVRIKDETIPPIDDPNIPDETIIMIMIRLEEETILRDGETNPLCLPIDEMKIATATTTMACPHPTWFRSLLRLKPPHLPCVLLPNGLAIPLMLPPLFAIVVRHNRNVPDVLRMNGTPLP
jgi:hypothetical protein